MMMATPTLVYSYVRMSSVTQIKGDSARRQIEQAREYAERNSYVLAPPLQDLGVSAFKGRNRQKGALGLFLTALKAGEIRPGILVIEAIDRLSREPPMEILMLLRDILQTGTSIHLLSLGQTLSAQALTESMWLLPTIASMAQLAHTESKQKSERISAAYVTRRKEAREGKVLKGNYHPAWLSRHYLDDETVEHRVIPEVAEAVNRIFELAATGLGAHTIAKTMNQAGIAPPRHRTRFTVMRRNVAGIRHTSVASPWIAACSVSTSRCERLGIAQYRRVIRFPATTLRSSPTNSGTGCKRQSIRGRVAGRVSAT